MTSATPSAALDSVICIPTHVNSTAVSNHQFQLTAASPTDIQNHVHFNSDQYILEVTKCDSLLLSVGWAITGRTACNY